MKKYAVLVITFLACPTLAVISALFLGSQRIKHDAKARTANFHDAEVRTANFVDEHHCPVYASEPAETRWSAYDGKLVSSEAFTIYDCGQHFGKVLIYASEVQPAGGNQ